MAEIASQLFHPLIAEWFTRKFGAPTDIQVQAWPLIARGKHVLITAPTGSGKTLAAFLWAINMLASGNWKTGSLSLLYISPLKALNNDIRENLMAPIEEIAALFCERGEHFPKIEVFTRSGDTPAGARAKMVRRPPEILITTPESLNILLTSEKGHDIFGSLRTVVLDEIHALFSTKRGVHLMTAVERLTLTSGEFQRIGLSATVRPAARACAFIGGYTRQAAEYIPREIVEVRSRIEKSIMISIEGPKGDEDSAFPGIVREIKRRIIRNRATLVFTNARKMCEKLARLINEEEKETIAYSHHGSLSKELRLFVERMFRDGRLRAIVATNSLELGIDIGNLDEVVLVETPSSVASALQRIGRAGHGVGETSRGVLFPLHGIDYLLAAVAGRMSIDRDIEEIRPVENPLDVLCQVILSMTSHASWKTAELFDFIRTCHPYRTLTRTQFDLVVGMLAGKYGSIRIGELAARVVVDTDRDTVTALPGVRMLLYLSGGTIADRGYFALRVEGSGERIGELDEEFVWERRIGHIFNLGTQDWRITRIDQATVFVVHAGSGGFSVPFWKGERQGSDFHFQERVGLFLEDAETNINDSSFYELLRTRHAMDDGAARSLINFLSRQKTATGGVLPHRHRILVEHVADASGDTSLDRIVIHTFWGSRINRPYSFVLQAAWEDAYGYTPDVFVDENVVCVSVPHELRGAEIVSLVQPEMVERLLWKKLPATEYFVARFRENAGRALLLPRQGFGKRTPFWFTRLRARKLYDIVTRYPDFPIVVETLRTCIKDDFDIDTLKLLLEELRSGIILMTEITIAAPTPFAVASVWRETDKYMYQGETPQAGRVPRVSENFFAEIASKERLRPKLDPVLVADFTKKIQKTAQGYSVDVAAGIALWVGDRVLVTGEEWTEFLDARAAGSGAGEPVEAGQDAHNCSVMTAMFGSIYSMRFPGAAVRLVVSRQNLPWFVNAFACPIDRLGIRNCPNDTPCGADELLQIRTLIDARKEQDDALAGALLPALVIQWLRYYGPVSASTIRNVFGDFQGAVFEYLDSDDAEIDVIAGELVDCSEEIDYCLRDNFERLLALTRRKHRITFTPVKARYFPLFLAAWQGAARRGEGIDALRGSLEKLFGCPCQAELWEKEILPARVGSYKKSMLDTLLCEEGLIWFGCGKERIAFGLEDVIGFLLPTAKQATDDMVPHFEGMHSFWDIARLTGLATAELTRRLWEMAWDGRITNTTFDALRKGMEHGFSAARAAGDGTERSGSRRPGRSGLVRWKTSRPLEGLWYRLHGDDDVDEDDEIELENARRELARLLLDRYGIVFRGMTDHELPRFGWQQLFRTFQLMELGGEIVSGYFIEGMPGPQFAVKAALDLLSGGLDENDVFQLNACDPASLCGTLMSRPVPVLPARIASNRVIYQGAEPVLVSKRNNAELEFFVSRDHPRFGDYVELLAGCLIRDWMPEKTLRISVLNGERADKSALSGIFTEYGFIKDYGCIVKRASY